MRRCLLVLISTVLACSAPDPSALEFRAPHSHPPGAADDAAAPVPVSAEQQFQVLEGAMIGKCGGCHRDGVFKPPPPQFLAGDAYATLTAYPGVIVEDPYESVLLTKGAHAGPAISPDADKAFYTSVKLWLDAEAILLTAKNWPSIDPVAIAPGRNVVDLSKACASGVTGVKLRFDASLVGDMLSLSDLTLITAAGSDVHVVHLRFHRIRPSDQDQKGTLDPADSFSNLDRVFAAGGETPLPPGFVVLSGDSFRSYDFAADRILIDAEKIEPGTVPVFSP
jgi:hypothetical protein